MKYMTLSWKEVSQEGSVTFILGLVKGKLKNIIPEAKKKKCCQNFVVLFHYLKKKIYIFYLLFLYAIMAE